MARGSLEWVRRSVLRLTWPKVALGLTVAACSSARNDEGAPSRTDDTTNEGEAPATLDAFYSQYIALACEYMMECYGVALDTYCDSGNLSLEAYYGPKVANLVYHREQATLCLASLRKSECRTFEAIVTAECVGAIEGGGQENDSCGGEFDCERHLYCKDDEQCPGVCLPRKAAGEDCNFFTPCLEGLACAASKCSEPAGEGEDCSSLPCSSGLSCVKNVCKTHQRFQRQLGESCESSADCYGFEHCDLEANTCVAAGREGDECGVVRCYVGYYCSESVCRARKENGETCMALAECQSNACIDGVCQAPREIGEDCSGLLDCRSATCGKNGKCSPLTSCE